MKLAHDWLELAYFVSQIVLALIAFTAAIFAFAQLRTLKLFELLKIVERPAFRASRRIVIRDICKRMDQRWWEDDQQKENDYEAAASDVCASYDIIGRLIEFDRFDGVFSGAYGGFFRRHWARSIFLTHHILNDYIEFRRVDYPDQYKAFSRLANVCEKTLPESAKKVTQMKAAD